MKIITSCFFVLLISCKTAPAVEPIEVSNQTDLKIEDSNATSMIQSCITDKILLFKKEAQCKSGSKVSSYQFQGQRVYIFEEGSCGADMTTPVFDKNCNKLGMLGGFIGNTIIQGKPFTEAVFQEVIWQQQK